MNSSFKSDLDRQVKERAGQMQLYRGWVKWLSWQIRRGSFTGPRCEIAQDWLVVNEFAGRAQERMAHGTPSEEAKRNLVTVLAFLECAREERDFAQAWTYVNLADALLPLIVSNEELPACTVRLRSADYALGSLRIEILEKTIGAGHDKMGRGLVSLLGVAEARQEVVGMLKRIGPNAAAAVPALKELLNDKDGKLRELVKDALAEIDVDADHAPSSSPPPPRADEPYQKHTEQLLRALLWNSLNRRISLKLSLWRSIQRRLAGALVASILAAALWTWVEGGSWLEVARLVEITLLGLFGGTLSAFLTARDSVVNIPSYEVIKTHTSLRMLLGAAGALVVYVIGYWVLDEKLRALIESKLFVFMSVGIAAGFSERLFINALEKAAKNLSMTGSTKKNEEAEDSSSAPDRDQKQKK